MRALVEATIEVIRPALQADGGDIVLRDVDPVTGVVSVTLLGACGNCPASTQTLKAGIERIMKDRVAGVTEVVNVDDTDDTDDTDRTDRTDRAGTDPTDEVVHRD